MKRIIATLLTLSFLLTACSSPTQNTTSQTTATPSSSSETQENAQPVGDIDLSTLEAIVPEFTGLDDKNLHTYLEDSIYEELITSLNSEDYVVEDVIIKYASKEYLEEVEFNSQSTSYFGYTTDELNDLFDGKKYIFTLSDNNETVVQELVEIDKSSEEIMLTNVAIGTGVILATVTLSVVAPAVGAPVAVQVILCASATGAGTGALSGAGMAGTISYIAKMVETGDHNEALDASLLEASDGFKWGAISGAIIGGSSEALVLKVGTKGGLTMSQVATIQKESKYPIELIKNLKSMEQYNICKTTGLFPFKVSGKTDLIRYIDLNYVDEITGKTNLELMRLGKSPIDPTGHKYELHHIGQKVDSPLAILTHAEHMENGNNSVWHTLTSGFENPSSQAGWTKQKSDFWKEMAEVMSKGIK